MIVSYLSLTWLMGAPASHRYQVESATLCFVVVGVAVRLIGHAADDQPGRAWFGFGWRTWLLWLGLALSLYWPALHVGLLSDDFGLVERAGHWNLSAPGPHLFRPLPLAVWAAILSSGGGALTLHLFNIVLHGTNAYLATSVASPFTTNRLWSVLAGLIVLASPLAPEPVVWCSGVFDVSMTTIACAAILLARDYDEAGRGRRATVFALVAIGLLTKETAIVVPPLLCLDALARGRWSRTLALDLALMAAGVGAFVGLRLILMGLGGIEQPVTKYLLQNWLFRTFGALAVPWRADVIRRMVWLAALNTLIVVGVVTRFFVVRNGSVLRTRAAALAGASILVSVLPTITFLYVAPDLQGARYLYLSTVPWAVLLVVSASDGGVESAADRAAALRRVAAMALMALVVASAVGVRLHGRYWTAAADLRRLIEERAAGNPAMRRCADLAIRGLPDSRSGVYIFRNSAAEAFKRDLAMRVVGVPGAEGCSFEWDGERFVQVTTPR